MNINKQLDKLCMEHFQNRAYVADGIFFGSNTNAWNSIHPKVLFVLKQPNSDDLLGEDYREYDFDTCVGEQVWRELLGRLYGMMHTDESGFPKYDKATEIKSLKEAFCQYPFAVINIIKDIGTERHLRQILKNTPYRILSSYRNNWNCYSRTLLYAAEAEYLT